MAKKTKKSKIEKKAEKKAAKKWPRGSRQRIGILLKIPRFLRRGHNAPRPHGENRRERSADVACGSIASFWRCARDVRSSPYIDRAADVPGWQKSASPCHMPQSRLLSGRRLTAQLCQSRRHCCPEQPSFIPRYTFLRFDPNSQATMEIKSFVLAIPNVMTRH
jgi:hypothetical protein